MSVKTLEIKPDRLLMNPNFDGYKLSLEELKLSRKPLGTPVHKTVLNSNQYGLLHAKLFGLHNHLVVDQFDNFSSVYFIDQQFNFKKVYVDALTSELVDPITVFEMPKSREQKSGDYNITMCFACPTYAVASDGMGTVFILATNDKRDDDEFVILFKDKVLSQEEQGFIITDALYKDSSKELHMLLLHIQEDAIDRFVSVIHWLTFRECEDSKGVKTWGQVALRQLKTKGEVQYLHLENNCENVYIVAENNVKFMLNSEHPVQHASEPIVRKVYHWSQNLEEITIKVPLAENSSKEHIKVELDQSRHVNISYDSKSLLTGELEGQVDSSLLHWTLNDNTLEVVLTKANPGLHWSELVMGDQRGEYLLDSSIVEEANVKLQGFTTENEAIPEAGTTFNSQQIEECDFETDKSETFERISGITNQVTHRIHLGSHQVLLSPYLNAGWPPALGIRHDVDVCLWQPFVEGSDFSCKHEGTLLAFGYVQASKTNKKFVICSPNLDYAVVSESSGHIFIYKQNTPLIATELRHRSTGRRITNVAQQHVFNLPNQDVLGIFAGNSHLFILCGSFIIALSISSNTN